MLDEKIQAILRELEQDGIPPTYTLSVSEVRRLSKDMGKKNLGYRCRRHGIE
jgi:hypothetical protein